MSKLRVNCFTISLDGYGAGPNQNEQNPIYRLGILGRTAQGWYVLSDNVEMRD